MGGYVQSVLDLQNEQRHQNIAKNQAASLGIAHVLRTGIHPDTGSALTPAERVQLAQKNRELQAQLQDLWNPRQDVNKMGKSESTASGVALPEGQMRKVADKLHLKKAPVAQPGAKTPQQQMDDLREITQKYQPQPGERESQASDTELQGKLQAIEADPKLTPEDKGAARRKLYGVGERPTLKLYTLADGTRQWLDASRPDLIPEGATAAGAAETSDTRARGDYAAFQKANPNYKESFEQWKAEQGAKGRATAKPESFDKQYQEILVKEQAGRPLSPDEKSRKAAWQVWNRETKIDPGVARAAAFGASRYVAVIDPQNPESVTMMRAGEAAKSHAGTPASISFQTDKAVTRWMTTGDGATKVNNFNTAIEHLKLLKEAGDALNNGDSQLFNKLANSFATATGGAAPSNFNAVKAAVAGEISKTFSTATIPEIEAISSTINSAESPEQILGAISYYTSLMGSKMDSLKAQYAAGKQGKPNFPGSGQSTPSAKHKIKIGNKMYTYNGTGDTADLKNYTEVTN